MGIVFGMKNKKVYIRLLSYPYKTIIRGRFKMKKRLSLLVMIVSLCLIFSACTQNAVDIEDYENQIMSLQEDNENLKIENNELKTENDDLKIQVSTFAEKIAEEKEQTIVQEGDVTVMMTGKDTFNGEYSEQYVGFIFSIKNNTEKPIKGIQGTATFLDLFGVDILSLNCDFTGITIEAGDIATVDDLSMDCNQFMDDHMKLYNTAYDDLNFEYKVKSIVFTDGSSKQGN